MTFTWPFEIPILFLIQQLGGGLLSPMNFFSFLGTEEFFLLILSALYWCVDATIGLRVAITLLLSNTLNDSLKLLFRGARPYWFDSTIKGFTHESSFGIPSGHSQNSMVVWGTIAMGFRKRWVTITSIIIIFLVGFSRMYLGVHWVSDVLTGWLIGLVLLWLVAKYEKPVVKWWILQSLWMQVSFSALIALAMIGIGLVWRNIFNAWQPPSFWLANISNNFAEAAINPAPISNAFTLAGLWFGMLIGASLIYKAGGHKPPSSPGSKIAAYLIGLVGVVVLWYGLRVVFPRSEDMISYTLRFVRYSLVGIWIVYLAPLVFQTHQVI